MKRILAAALFCALSAPAFAVCPSTLQLKDNAGATPTAKYTDDGSGNCMANVALQDGADVSLGAKADAAASSDTGTFSLLALFKRALQTLTTIATNTGASIPAGSANIGNVGQISQYPAGATPITASATGTTAATTATLAANVSLKTYLCSMSIRASATAAVTGNATVTGTVTGTLNFTQWTAPAASGLGVSEMIFSPCVPSSAINTAIAVISAAPGTGGVVSVTATGYQL